MMPPTSTGALAALILLWLVSPALANLKISELDAIGSDSFPDTDGEPSDWIELENRGTQPAPLGGYFLTDDPEELRKWALPQIELAAGDTLLVFASGKNRSLAGAELHTNFRLGRTGEYLALVAPDGTTIIDDFGSGYPEQSPGFSYGRSPDGELGYFDPPTPGAPNGQPAFSGLVADTEFSADRGFYEEPFQVEITTATEGAQIRYTLDGSKPTESHGSLYGAPLTISATTALRAIAYRDGFRSSNVDTHTYLFLDQVLQQPRDPAGFPSDWNSIEGSQQSEYEMDPEVVGQLYTEEEVKAGLRSLPTVCLTTSVDDLFDGDTGIYINAKQRGDQWEREISMEFFDFPHGKDLQVNTGLRMNGNFSRSKIQPKHNMRVVFREEYGPSRLEFELYENGEVTRFNSLILRGLSGDSWAHARHPHAQYIRDQWFRDAHESMGYEGIHQREVQLYINGLYWGMYHIFERVEDDSMAERFGGTEEDWEVIKDGNNSSVVSIDGGTDRWDALLDIIQAGGLSDPAQYSAVQEYLDLDAFIDYLLLNFYGGNDDWCSKNYRAAVRLNPPGKYKFFPHDTERAGYNALNSAGLNKNSTGINNTYRPTYVHQQLAANAEYRLRFADRTHRFLFNGGALTEGPAGALWQGKADQIREALKAECARWGDFAQDQRGANKINTLAEWQILVDREMNTWFPQRPAIVVEQLRSRSLYPEIEAPAFNQHGGNVPPGFKLLFTIPGSHEIYYTTDGSDPRLPGGAIHPQADKATSGNEAVTMITSGAAGWEYLDDGSDQGSSQLVAGNPAFGPDNWKHPEYSPASPWATGSARLGYAATENTTVSYGPSRSNKFLTTYFRKAFDLSEASLVSSLLLEIERDDGAIVYLNGIEVARDNMPGGVVHFDTPATESVGGENETTFFPFQIDPATLVEGRNVLAIEVHQRSASSSDLSIDARLTGTRVASGSAVPIDGQVTVKARAYDPATQSWSALNEATFSTGRPPSPGDLTVSELHYHPAGPSAAESANPAVGGESDFEFIELINLSADPLDLSGLAFSDGIEFTFPPQTDLLGPGARVLIVNNRAAFELRYADRLPVPIAGEFGETSSLSNGGEQIALSAGETELLRFTFDDATPWPESADGEGYSLVLINPAANPDLSEPSSWRTSKTLGGSPGDSDTSDLASFAANQGIANPYADHDFDGLATIIEYATGSPHDSPSSPKILDARVERSAEANHIVLDFPVAPGADDIDLTPELSRDLSSWIAVAEAFVFLGESRLPDGRATRSYRVSEPFDPGDEIYFRLRATPR